MKSHSQRIIFGLLLPVVAAVVLSCAGRQETDEQRRAAIADHMETILEHEMLARWYPLVVDSVSGGYLTDFDYCWEPDGPQTKMIATQARHIWTTARAAGFTGDTARYVPLAAHGFRFLRDRMWDREYGGFYNLVNRAGEVIPDNDGEIRKLAYGNAFAIYGLAAYYRVSGDGAALHLAQEAFQWLEDHSHDPDYGGYFQFLRRDGQPFPDGFGGTPPKDQNSSIHLLEALTELYQVWPDDLVRKRLTEMLRLVRDTMIHPRGYLQLFFQRDWTPVSYRDSSAAVRETHYNLDHVSFGHDIETAYLMLEASHVLGVGNDSTTLRIGKKMVDHALQNGWDTRAGGFYDRGYYFPGADTLTIIRDTKNWWAQAEGLNSLLLMSDLFPADPWEYYQKFLTQWHYVDTNLIDHRYGGWYSGGLDKELDLRTAKKSHIWKGAYHTVRAMVNCIQRLQGHAVEYTRH